MTLKNSEKILTIATDLSQACQINKNTNTKNNKIETTKIKTEEAIIKKSEQLNQGKFLQPILGLEKVASARSAEASFFHYLQEIQKFPLLTFEEEKKYGELYQKTGDTEAAKMLIQSHLRLVVKMASKFRSYGLPIVDLVSEGNLGLIQAVKKFNPSKGFRFSTYSMWWIKAYIQEYILRSWSLVKIGTTTAQKKLFFNLRKIKKRLDADETGNLMPAEVKRIAHDLNVSSKEVIDMNSRLQNSDGSLNYVVGEDGFEIGDQIPSNQPSQEDLAITKQEKLRQSAILKAAIAELNPREKEILVKRQLAEEQPTLEELSKVYKVSKERVRQIEASALDKIKKFFKKVQ